MTKKLLLLVLTSFILQPTLPLLAMQEADSVEKVIIEKEKKPAQSKNILDRAGKVFSKSSVLFLVILSALFAYKYFKNKPQSSTSAPQPNKRFENMQDTPCSICLADADDIENPMIPKCGHAMCAQACYPGYIQEKVEMKPADDGTGKLVTDEHGKVLYFEERYIDDQCPVCRGPLFPNNVHQQKPRTK